MLTWQQRVCIVQDVAKGLLFLHQQNVIHRDFKAANVLLTEVGRSTLSSVALSCT